MLIIGLFQISTGDAEGRFKINTRSLVRFSSSTEQRMMNATLYGGHHSGMTLVHAMVSIYCLSNAMHGQNTNLPVCLFICLSVCVSVTISVNSPTGQTPHRIFTVDTLTTRRRFTQGWCAFWEYRWWIITFTGPKSPRTSILGAWVGISSQICEKFK